MACWIRQPWPACCRGPTCRRPCSARRAAPGWRRLWDVGFALVAADVLAAADAWWRAILVAAQARGSILTFARCASFQAMTALRAGDLSAAEAHARASVDAADEQQWYLRRTATAWLVETLVERGDPPAAAAALTAAEGDGDLPDRALIHFLRYSRGKLKVARGELADGLADLYSFRRSDGSSMRNNPAVRPWRSDAALVEFALGRPAVARRLAAEDLELAASLGGAWACGVALRAEGLIQGGRQGEDRLRKAEAVLARSPARLEHARALIDLGAAIRRSGRRVEARDPLAEGMTAAHRCGATPLVERARAELRAAGARPRRLRRTGVEALTASEHRVAVMAAAGMTNREIAQALFVTLRTVEIHLTHTYGKLGIATRTQLAVTLAAPGQQAPVPMREVTARLRPGTARTGSARRRRRPRGDRWHRWSRPL